MSAKESWTTPCGNFQNAPVPRITPGGNILSAWAMPTARLSDSSSRSGCGCISHAVTWPLGLLPLIAGRANCSILAEGAYQYNFGP